MQDKQEATVMSIEKPEALSVPGLKAAAPIKQHEVLWPWIVGVVFTVLGIGALITYVLVNKPKTSDSSKVTVIKTQQVDTQNLSAATTAFKATNNDEVVINGQLQAANSLVILPTDLPTNPRIGQIYLNQTDKKLYYYNGTIFASLGNQITNVNSTTTTGVTSLQGQTGVVSLLGGNGLTVGTGGGNINIGLPQNLRTSASPSFNTLKLSSLDCTGNLNGGKLTTDASGNIVCSDDDASPPGTGITSLNGQIGSTQTFANDTNITITSSGDIHTLGWSGTLSVARGGTGLNGSASNGQLLIGNGSGFNLASLTQGTGITITPGAGSISIASTLGTSVDTTEIVDGTILFADINQNGCALNEIIKWNGAAWACAPDAGGSGVGDEIQVNGGNVSASNTANFVNTAATAAIGSTTWTLAAGSPDQLTVAIGLADGSNAGLLSANAQTIGGTKTFSNTILPGVTNSIDLGDGTHVWKTAFVNTITPSTALTVGSASQTFNLQGASLSQITVNTNAFTFPGAGGVLCVEASSTCGFAGSSGSGSYIQNGTSIQANANFAIQSAAAGSIGAVVKGAASQSVDLQQWQDSAGTPLAGVRQTGNIYAANYVNSSNPNNSVLSLNSTGALLYTSVASNIALKVQNQAGAPSGDLLQLLNTGGSVLSKFNNNGDLQIGGTSSAATTTAFQIQDTTGSSNLFVADTSNNRIGIGTASPIASLTVKGYSNSSGVVTMTASNGATTFTTSSSITLNVGDYIIPTTTTTQAKLISIGGSGSSFTVSNAFGANVTGETFTIYHPISNFNDSSGNTAAIIQGSTGYLGLGTATPSFRLDVFGTQRLTTNGVGNIGLIVKAAAGQTADLLQVRSSAAPSTGDLFVIDNSGKVGIGAAVPTNNLHVFSTTLGGGITVDGNNNPGIKLNNNGTLESILGVATSAGGYTPGSSVNDTVLQLGNRNFFITSDAGTTDNFKLSATGALTLKNSSNSSSAFLVQSATAAETLFSIDTSNRGAGGGNLIKIGNSTGTDGGLTILQVDSSAGVPTSNLAALNGGLFFDSTAQHLKVIENGVVKTICNLTDSGCGTGVTTTFQDAYDNSSSPATITTSSAAKTILFQAGSTFDSATLFQVRDSGSNPILAVDTSNGRVGIGGAAATTALKVSGTSSFGYNNNSSNLSVVNGGGSSIFSITTSATDNLNGAFLDNPRNATSGTTLVDSAFLNFTNSYWNGSSAVNNSFALKNVATDTSGNYKLSFQNNGGTEEASIAGTGATTFVNSINSSAAFKIQSATAAETLFTVDTTARGAGGGNLIKIGNSTGTDTDLTILQVDSSAGVPTSNLAALNGGLFYDSSDSHLKVVEANTVNTVCTSVASAVCSSAYGGGANLALSNLTATAINQDLIFANSGAGHTLGVSAPAGNTAGDALTLQGGDATAGATARAGGDLNLYAGNAAAGSGNANGGSINIDSGTKISAGTSNINIGVTNATGIGIGHSTASVSITSANWGISQGGGISLVGGLTNGGSEPSDITTMNTGAVANGLGIQPGYNSQGNGTGATLTLMGGRQIGTTCNASNCTGGTVTIQGGTANGAGGTNHLGGNVVIDGGSASGGSSNTGGTVTIGATNASAINIGKTASNITTTVTGLSVFKPSTGNDSPTAFQIQNAGGTDILTTDTTNSKLIVRGINSDAVLGGELVTSQNFTTANWSTCNGGAGGWSGTSTTTAHNSGNVVTCSSTGTNFTVSAGATYQVSFSITGNNIYVANHKLAVSLGGTNASTTFEQDNPTMIITTTNTNALVFTPETNFVGTISNVSIKQITSTSNSVLSVKNSSNTVTLEVRSSGSSTNSFIGLNAGQNNSSLGLDNTALGSNASQLNSTGTDNTAIGYNALKVSNSSYNTAVGSTVLQSNVSGYFNTGLGFASLAANTTGSANTALGTYALLSNTTGGSNTAIGMQALASNISGSWNHAIGNNALDALTGGNGNLAFGSGALGGILQNDQNTAVGDDAGNNITNTSYSTFLGNQAGAGSGVKADNDGFGNPDNQSYQTAIGAFAQVQCAYCMVLGATDNTAPYVGIGTTTPINTLSVSPVEYKSGTISQTGPSATVVGVNTNFVSSMIGAQLIYADGVSDTVSAVTDATHLTVLTSRTHASSNYRIQFQGLQVTNAGKVGIGTTTSTRALTVATNDTYTSAPELLVTQAGTGDTTIQFENSSKSFTAGIDASDSSRFKISSSTASGAYFGNKSTGSQGIANNNTLICSQYTAPTTGTITSLSAYVTTVDAGPNNEFALAIYSNSAGLPNTKLANSTAYNLIPNSWNRVPISQAVTSGTLYWLCWNSNGTSNNLLRSDTSGGSTAWNFGVSFTNATNWPTFSSSGSSSANLSIYANYDTFNSSLFSLSDSGQAVFQNSTDSATAFQIQNASGSTTVLGADSASLITTATGILKVAETGGTSSLLVTDSTGNLNLTTGGTSRINEEFTSITQDAAWTFNNGGAGSPGTNSLTSTAGHDTIAVPSGSDHDCWSSSMACARLMRSGGGDGVYETSLDTALSSSLPDLAAYSSGLMFWKDNSNFVRFEFRADSGGVYIRAHKVIGGTGTFNLLSTGPVIMSASGGNRIRVVRSGTSWTMYYSLNAGVTWYTVGSITEATVMTQAGLYTNNAVLTGATAPALSQTFDYYHYTSSEAKLQAGKVTFRNTSDSTSALQVQNATGINVINVSTSDGATAIGTGTGVLGNNTIGTTADTGDNNEINGYQVTTGSIGPQITSMSVYITNMDPSSTNRNFQLAIYSDSSNAPSALVASSDTGTITASNQWYTLNIAASLQPNTKYWLVYNSNASNTTHNNIVHFAGPSNSSFFKASTFGTWPSTLSGITQTSTPSSIYASFSNAADLFVGPGGAGSYFQSTTNNSNAFSLQNSNGSFLFNADTTTSSTNLIANGGFESNLNGWNVGPSQSAPYVISRDTANQEQGNASLKMTNTATGDGAIYQATLGVSTYTLSFWAKASAGATAKFNFGYAQDGSTETGARASVNNDLSTSWTRYSFTFTTTAITNTPYLFFKQNDATSRSIWIDAVQLEAGSTANGFVGGGALQVLGIVNSPLIIQPKQDSTSAFQILTASGTVTLLNVDTVNQRIGIGTTSPSAKFDVAGGMSQSGTLPNNSTAFWLHSTLNSATETSAMYGIQNDTIFSPQAASLSTIYTNSNVAKLQSSSAPIGDIHANYSRIDTAGSFTGTMTNGYAFRAAAPQIGSATLISNYYGLRVDNPSQNTGNTSGTVRNFGANIDPFTAAPGGGGTLNNYGVVIGTSSSGTNNYGLLFGTYSGAGGLTPATGTYAIYNNTSLASYSEGDITIAHTSSTAFQVQTDSGATTLLGIDTSGNGTVSIQGAADNGVVNIATTNSLTVTIGKNGGTGTLTVYGASTFNGSLTIANGHVKSTQTTAPTIGTPAACGGGTGPSAAVTASSTDTAGSFTITAGSTGSPTTCDTIITFNTAYGAAPKSIVITPKGATGAARQAYISATAAGTFTVSFGTNPANSEANTYNYIVIE